MAWARVMRPLHLSGLGIHNLTALGWALKMRWLWIQRTEPDNPLLSIAIEVPRQARSMFYISTCSILGNGEHTLFWTNKWAHGKSLDQLMPTVMPFVRRRGWKRCTVREALTNNSWIHDIVGGLPMLVTDQVLQLMDIIVEVRLTEQQDQQICTPSSTGGFSTKSTYEHFFIGAPNLSPSDDYGTHGHL